VCTAGNGGRANHSSSFVVEFVYLMPVRMLAPLSWLFR
jgi:hypothetical protein